MLAAADAAVLDVVDAFIELEEVEVAVDDATFVANFAVVAILATLGLVVVDATGIDGFIFFSLVAAAADVVLVLLEGFSTSTGFVGAYTGAS